MGINLAKYGIAESAIDINRRFLISCLNCEFENYQPMMLEIVEYEFFEDTEEGKAAYESFGPAIPNKDKFSKIQYSIWQDDESSLGGYEGLDEFQEELEQISLIMERNGDGFSLDGKDGLVGTWGARGYPISPETFLISHENSTSLLELLDELELPSPFWVKAVQSMRKTLTKNLCLHDWTTNIDGFLCANCNERSTLEEMPKIGRSDWISRALAALEKELNEDPFPPDLAADKVRLVQLAVGGSAQAMKLIGVMHARAEENELAAEWYQKAIERGNLDALSNLGVLRFIEGDRGAAIDLLVAAANRGSKMAMGNLGKAYADLGKESLSLLWYSRAAQFGDGLAALVAAEGYKKINKHQEAIEMLRIGADLGLEDARLRLGELEFDLTQKLNELRNFVEAESFDAESAQSFVEFGELLFTDAATAINGTQEKDAIKKAFSESSCENCSKDISSDNVTDIDQISYQYCESCGWLSWQSEQNLEGQKYVIQLKPNKVFSDVELVKFGLQLKEMLSTNRDSWGEFVISTADSESFRSAPEILNLVLVPRNWSFDIDYDEAETADFNKLPINEKVENLLENMYDDFGSLGYKDAKHELTRKFEAAKVYGFDDIEVLEIGTTDWY